MTSESKHHLEEFQPFTGIVLRTFPYAESDVILRIYTPDFGKRSVLARGVRKEKAKFSVAFDVFDSGEFTTKKGRGSLESLVHFTPHRSLSALRHDLDRFVCSSCIVEAFDNLTQENDESDAKEIYETLALALRAVEETAELKEMLRALYYSFSTLLNRLGFAAVDDTKAPSLKNLEATLNAIENFSERELKSRGAMNDIFLQLKRSISVAPI